MKIACRDCNIFLGEIMPGSKLRKGIVYLCNVCGSPESLPSPHREQVDATGNDFLDMLFNLNKKGRS